MAAMASDLDGLAASVLASCGARGLKLATAESCTGGMIAAALTAIAGSSAVFERGYVVYSNLAKQQMLGVPGETLARHGAVSAQTAIAMAEAALARSGATIAVAFVLKRTVLRSPTPPLVLELPPQAASKSAELTAITPNAPVVRKLRPVPRIC
jgi:hypothetical protein